MRRLAPKLSPSTILRSGGGRAFSTSAGSRMRSQKPINLLRGWPNPSLLPASQLNAAAQIAFTTPAIYEPGLQYGPDPGYQPLRDEVSKWLAEFYQTDQRGDPEEICITGGASQNVACVLQVFSDPIYTKRVWVVAPCYFLACRIFEDAGFAGRLRAVPEGETGEGIDLEWLEREIEKVDADIDQSEAPLKQPRSYAKIYRHIIYCVPTFSNPSGSSMSLNARENIVKLARRHDALIISDDVYDFLQWPTTPTITTPPLTKALLPRLVDLDRTLTPTPIPESFGNVLSNGSFSKIAGPGMRVGFASATCKLIYGLSQCGSSRSGGAPSQMSSTIMHQLLASGALTKHIHEFLQPTYQRRHAIMMNALKEYVIPLGVRFKDQSLKGRDIFGGFFIWLDLPEGVDAEVLANWCLESENLVVAAGPIFAVDGDDSLCFQTCIRVCFSWEGEPELQEGIERLGRALKDVLSGKAGGKEGLLSGSGLKQSLGEFQ